MPTQTLQATANETPDATLGGVTVASVSNTGHASTLVEADDTVTPSAEASARWFTFPAFTSPKVSVTLKVAHTTSGTLGGGTAHNSWVLEYSLNSGSSWNAAASRSDFTAAQGPTTFSVALSTSQDLTQVQVREDILASVVVASGHAASATATISDIRIEVVTQGGNAIVIM